MHLTLIQMFKKSVPGHIFRGKRRLVKQVTASSMRKLTEDYERQETNMLLLRHPYLTLEESSGHTKDLNKRKEFIDKMRDMKILKKMKPHVTLEDRLNHLRVKECWD